MKNIQAAHAAVAASSLQPMFQVAAPSPAGMYPLVSRHYYYYYYEPDVQRIRYTSPTYSVKLRLWKVSTFYFKIVATRQTYDADYHDHAAQTRRGLVWSSVIRITVF